jgi:hypothetical protein
VPDAIESSVGNPGDDDSAIAVTYQDDLGQVLPAQQGGHIRDVRLEIDMEAE